MPKNKIYEGKAKILYQAENQDEIICYFKDSATMLNGKTIKIYSGKGIFNNKITELIFNYLKKNEIPTHFIRRLNDREQLLQKLKIIPLEVIIRNRSAGSFVKRYNAQEGLIFNKPIFEISYKCDELNDPLLNDDHAIALKIVTKKNLMEIKRLSLKINKILQSLFLKINIDLVDFKLEFGLNSKGQIILADEFSPDNSRLWDIKTNKKLDKDNFRLNIGNLLDAYKIVYERLVNELS